MDKPYKGRIDNWYKREYADGFIIVGIPVGHPKFVDFIYTSKVVKLDEENNKVETMNSLYDLGYKRKD